MSRKAYLNILKFGIYLSLIVIFFVFKNLLFPYITSKQIAFNVIVEILVIIWVGFIVKFPEYRPKKSYVTYGLISFFMAMIASCFVSVDFNLSFWGDVERMLGAFHILHFFFFYLIIITVFKEWKDWKMLFIISVIYSVFMSVIGLTVHQHATIGNTAYVSGYLIFNIYFCFLLFIKEKSDMKWLYFIPLIFQIPAFMKANTTGAVVGVLASALLAAAMYVLLSKYKKIKIAGISIVAVLFLMIIGVFTFHDSAFVKNNNFLKVISEIDFQKNTFQTRLISWKAGIIDLKEHPVLGVGHGNYAVIFDKYFDPKFYDYTRGETYFDRAHNNLIDIVSTTGIVGLLTYLSIFIALAYYLIMAYRKGKINVHEFVIVSSLVVAYFVQNLAVFDSLVTYLSIMMTLGFSVWLVGDDNNENEKSSSEKEFTAINYIMISGLFVLALVFIKNEKFKFFAEDNTVMMWTIVAILVAYMIFEIWQDVNKWHMRANKDEVQISSSEVIAILATGVVMLTILFQFNYKPIQMLVQTIDGQVKLAQGDIEGTYEAYKKALSHNTILDRDSRTSFLRIFSDSSNLNKVSREKGEEILDYAIKLGDENIAYNRLDSMAQMIFAQVLNTATFFYKDDAEKYAYFQERTIQAIDTAIEASPRRIPVYFQKVQFLLNQNKQDEAVDILRYTTTLSDTYYDSFCHLARILMKDGESEEVNENLEKCLNLRGGKLLGKQILLAKAEEYKLENNLDMQINVYLGLTALENKNPEHWIGLAKLYSEAGEKEKAINAANRIIKLDPKLAPYVEDFIEGVK